MSLPNPISLQQLCDSYDALVASSSSDVRSLRLVCSILMTVLGPVNAWKDRLQQTARRCHLIEGYLNENDDDDGGEDEESFHIPISLIAHSHATATWTWSIVNNTKDLVALSMDREELIREEATLWDMANTPIPVSESIQIISQRKHDLIQEIRSEWAL